MFLIREANRLSSYKNRDYIIKIIVALLFNSLYNLFNIKLIALRSYLNDTLIKE